MQTQHHTHAATTAAPCDAEGLAIESARAGDAGAFARLVEAYQDPIFNLCYRLLDNPGDAEDAAQEVFLRAFTRLGTYDPARSFKTWLFSIAHHYCIDRIRRRRLHFLSLDDELSTEGAAWRSTLPTPEETTIRRERERDVQSLLDTLPAVDRSALVMRYWYDLSYEEIAAALGATVSSVKSRLHRARGALAPAVGANEPRLRHPRPSLRTVAAA